MSSTVRINKRDKQELENLINYLNYKGKIKLTQEQMISLLIEAGLKRKNEILEQIIKHDGDDDGDDWKNDSIFSLLEVELEENASETVDETVYGD